MHVLRPYSRDPLTCAPILASRNERACLKDAKDLRKDALQFFSEAGWQS
jgi:hypothetical protein